MAGQSGDWKQGFFLGGGGLKLKLPVIGTSLTTNLPA